MTRKNNLHIEDRVKKDNRHGTVVAHSALTTRKVRVHWDGVPPHGGQYEWHDIANLRRIG